MNCEYLAWTGTPLLDLLMLAGVCFMVGLLPFLIRSRRSRTAAALTLLLLLSGGLSIGSIGGSAAHAALPGCPAPGPVADDSVTINQSADIQGLAPGVMPQPISGVVVNRTPENTFITAVTVSVVSVTKAPDATNGTCDVNDYFLLAPRMPVGRALSTGGSAPFAGASIGFSDRSTNQDACKGARVNLRYDSS